MRIQGSHALVTGGAAGIGLEVCKLLVQRGAASVAVLDVSQAALDCAVKLLSAEGSETQCRAYTVDVTSCEQARSVSRPLSLRGTASPCVAVPGVRCSGTGREGARPPGHRVCQCWHRAVRCASADAQPE